MSKSPLWVALDLLAVNLGPQDVQDGVTLGQLIHDLTKSRHRTASMVLGILNSTDAVGIEQKRQLFASYGRPDSVPQLDDVLQLLYPPNLTPVPFIDKVLKTLSQARAAIASGEGESLTTASGGTITAATVGADLIEVERLLTRFAECLRQPVPLDAATPARLYGLATRFRRAADLLSVEVPANQDRQTNSEHSTTTIVLWEGAPDTKRNRRIALVRSAYLEAHGNVEDAREILRKNGHPMPKSTFYDYIKALDNANPHWRASVLHSGESGIPADGGHVRARRKSRGKSR